MTSRTRIIEQPLYHIAALLAATVGCASAPSGLVERQHTLLFDSLPPVHVRLRVAPELAAREDRYLAAAEAALRRFGEWYGPYPHDELTLVDPGWRDVPQTPGTVVVDSRQLSFGRSAAVEAAVIHAVSRRFWQLPLPAANADEAPLIDGLTTFSTARALRELLPENRFDERRFFGGFLPHVVPSQGTATDPVRIGAHSEQFPGSRAALALATLERYIGWGALQAALWEFAQRRRLNRARASEFVEILQNSTSHGLEWYVNELRGATTTFDYGLASFESKPAERSARYETVVVMKRFGDGVFSASVQSPDGVFPSDRGIELRVAFESGDEIREYWDGRDEEARYVYESTTPAVTATVDPEGVLRLDVNPANNHRRLGGGPPRTAVLDVARWSQRLQHALLTYGFFF